MDLHTILKASILMRVSVVLPSLYYTVLTAQSDAAAIENFNNRITYILNGHKNALVDNKPWSELGDYIFGFEAQNEYAFVFLFPQDLP